MLATNKKELTKAVREKSITIEVTGDYAEKVMEKYQKSFHSKPISISPAIAFVGFIDILATELTWYEINTYQKNDLMLVRK